jgi:hypothetical protein
MIITEYGVLRTNPRDMQNGPRSPTQLNNRAVPSDPAFIKRRLRN